MSIPRSATFWWATGLALLGVVSQLDPAPGSSPSTPADRIKGAIVSGAIFFALPYGIRAIARRLRGRRRSDPPASPVPPTPPPAPAPATSRPRGRSAPPPGPRQLLAGVDLDVVGESFYMANIRRLIDGELLDCLATRYPRSQDFESTDLRGAQLVREPDNPYDANAVAVHVHGYKVGYLARHSAAQVAVVMEGAGTSTIDMGHVRFVWKIRDYDGRRLRYDELKIGVKLG